MKNKKMLIITGIICVVLLAGIWHWWSEKQNTLKNEEQIKEENVEKIDRAGQDGIPTIVISNAEAKPGKKVTIDVSVVNNPGILGMSLNLSYDENVMKLIKVNDGEAFDKILDFNYSKELKSGCVFLWDGESINSDQILDGKIMSLEFEILKTAPSGKSSILLIDDESGTVDNDLETIDLRIENGTITII